jgi:hypothetical protein
MIISNLNIQNTRTTFLINNEKEMYINYNSNYKKFISSNYDGPLILALPIAMKNNEKLIIKGKISYKLFHNITNHLMKIINIMIPECNPIQIIPDEFSYGEKYDNTAVGCGLSCGIDSLCCLEDYYFNCQENPYKLTHVTNFHAGASTNQKQYQKRLNNVIEYNKNTTLSLLDIITNFTNLNDFKHQKIHVLRNLSIPLFFQKLFCKYYYSSTYSYIDSKIKQNSYDFAYSDPITIPLLSTENMEFISHGCQYTRPQKTLKILSNPLNHKHLDICVDGKFVENTNTVLNCSTCWKCLRTLATLDHYNKLHLFKHVFSLKKYASHKKSFIQKLNKNDPLQREIIELYYQS